MLLSLISGENPIVEGAFEGGGLFDTEEAASLFAETQLATLDDEDSPEAQIIYRGPEQIYLPVEGDTYYSVYDGETTTLETGIMPCVDIAAGIITWKQAAIKNSSVYKIPYFGAGTDYKTMWYYYDTNKDSQTHSGLGVKEIHNCVPTTVANILWYWGAKRGRYSVTDRFSSSYSVEDKMNYIYRFVKSAMYTSDKDGTFPEYFLWGYEGYLGNESSGTWSSQALRGTTINAYKPALDAECPVHMTLYAHTNKSEASHAVMCFGYAQSTSGKNYLFIMDGYNTNDMFIDPNYYPPY